MAVDAGTARGDADGVRSDEGAGVESLRLLYQETCRQHQGITDFRAKLLALLPLAAGAGVLLLLGRDADTRFLGAIGLYGLAVTAGLFLY